MGLHERRPFLAAHPLTRRTFLQTAAAAAAGPFVSTPARAQGFTWKRFQRKELFLLLTKHPFIEVLEKHIPEFESLSGMKVKWETLPEIQARQKLTVEMTANAGGIDAFFTSLHVEKKRFWKAGWYHPLNKFLQDPSLTSPDFDWNDFSPGARAGVTQPDGSISALAAFIDANVLFYRKDLFAAKNVTPPKTLAELEQLVPKLHAPPGTYGIVLRGLKNANATQYPSILFPMGGTYLRDGKAVLDSKEGVAALDLYARLLRQYAPPGVVNFNWYECSASFMQGQVAIYMDGVNFASQFEDAAKSKVVGKVGYAMLPSGPGGHFSPIYITGMAVSSQSRSKEAGYLFAQWATKVFVRIALPLVRPGVMATAILSFVFSWNNFLFSVILAGRETRTLPIAVFNMISYEEINWGTLAAAATLTTLPVLLVALFAQRHMVTGLTFGAVKY
jgi:multiple sugar transport system substrate-binding protein